MIGLCGPDAQKAQFIRTTTIALLAWQHWHHRDPGYVHVEESGEALLARLGHKLHLHPKAVSIDDCLDLYITLPGPKDVRDVRAAVSQSLITMFGRSIRISLEKASKPDTSFVQYQVNVATAQHDVVWDRMHTFPGPLHCNAQEIKDVMFHSLRLLTSKTAVSEAVTEFMTHNVARTTHSDWALHNDTFKDIVAVARGNAPAIVGI